MSTQTLRKVLALGATRVVPGHGLVLEDDAYARFLIELLEETRRQVQGAVNDGLDLEDTGKRVDLSRFRRELAGDDYWRGRAFDEFYLQPAVGQAFEEAKGEPIVEGSGG